MTREFWNIWPKVKGPEYSGYIAEINKAIKEPESSGYNWNKQSIKKDQNTLDILLK